ncbi:hypothetical protein [Gallaecimonas pentaromativorans]|uniref:Uncharacterized protein n=1 Tax=Gallaecimonas pentaromativorans TaxID=584787 RepID=A0A3N1P2V0_9GAMM|nr:hypothetical protein [Gallaecimonas pentaromativorans]MED5526176.1 hypothetical protein [Pseudomonadota bacterium]ROQ19196.1 hypothetical protein EDC28_112119 [Gallaecimonas pentaromativorans]
MESWIRFDKPYQRTNPQLEQALREELLKLGFTDQAVAEALKVALPLFNESKDVVSVRMKADITVPLEESQLKALNADLSAKLADYQKSVSDFISKIIVLLAIAHASR